MVTIKIGGSEMTFENLSSIDENWINQQINGRRGDSSPVCVRVTLNTDAVNIVLSGGECSGGAGGVSRQLTADEAEAFELWERLGLNGRRIEGGKLVAFLKQVRRIAE